MGEFSGLGKLMKIPQVAEARSPQPMDAVERRLVIR